MGDFEEYQAKVTDVLKILHEELDAKDNGEVDRRLSALRRQQRKEALLAMEKPVLKALCDELQADAFVKPVMIERLLEREMELGCPTEVDEPAKKKARTSKK